MTSSKHLLAFKLKLVLNKRINSMRKYIIKMNKNLQADKI